jgi:polyisoprenoid-binding protein YceI
VRIQIVLSQIATALLLLPVARADDYYKIDPEHTRVGFSVRHLGINYNQVLESGVAAVGEEVTIEITAEAAKATAGQTGIK